MEGASEDKGEMARLVSSQTFLYNSVQSIWREEVNAGMNMPDNLAGYFTCPVPNLNSTN